MGSALPRKTDADSASGLFRRPEWGAGLDAVFIWSKPDIPSVRDSGAAYDSTLRHAAVPGERLSIPCQKGPISASAIINSVIAIPKGPSGASFWRLFPVRTSRRLLWA